MCDLEKTWVQKFVKKTTFSVPCTVCESKNIKNE